MARVSAKQQCIDAIEKRKLVFPLNALSHGATPGQVGPLLPFLQHLPVETQANCYQQSVSSTLI